MSYQRPRTRLAAAAASSTRLTDAAAFAEQIRPLVDAFAQSAGPDLSADNPLPNQPSLPDAPVGDGSLLADDEAEANLPQTTTQETSPADRRYPGYTIYSTRWDQTLDAEQLYQPDDALNLQQIDETERQQARRLALRLQRRLLAARLRRWSFDQDEGCLDSRRLARLLTLKPPYAVFRQEDETPVPEACVTALMRQDEAGIFAQRRPLR